MTEFDHTFSIPAIADDRAPRQQRLPERYAVLTSLQALHAALYTSIDDTLRQQWRALFETLQQKTLFQHIAWHEAFIAGQYRPELHGQLLYATVSRAGQTIAVVPLSYRKGRRYGLPTRIIELLHPTDMGVRDLAIHEDVDSRAVLDTILQALPNAGYTWDIAELADAAANSYAYRVFAAAAGPKLSVYHHDSNRLKSVGGRDQCFSLISKSHIKKTKRKRKHMEALGKVAYELITDPAALPQAFEIFLDVEDSSWKGSDGKKTSLRHDIPQKMFYESLLGNPAPGLNCCAVVMRLDGKPVAAKLCTRTGDTLFMLKISYDDRYQEHSPGNLLLLYALEEFSEDPSIDYISFITGGEWTLRWNPERVPVYQCSIFNRNAMGMFIAALAYSENTVRKIKQILKKKIAKESTQRAGDTDE